MFLIFFSKVPAKIASFDDEYVATYKEDVKLHCQAVGLPTPDIRYWLVLKRVIEDFLNSFILYKHIVIKEFRYMYALTYLNIWTTVISCVHKNFVDSLY